MNKLLLSASVLFSAAAFAQVTYTGSGTFVVPDGVTSIHVELIGAGGNGYLNGGGGGGGGAPKLKIRLAIRLWDWNRV
jgi:hypothetical protein